MNCNFNPIFFHLNYHHTLLYIHGLGPRNYNLTMDDIRQVSISSKEVINCYTQLYLTKSINYTWAAVHNLFMAGTSYLYSLYNSGRDSGHESDQYRDVELFQLFENLVEFD